VLRTAVDTGQVEVADLAYSRELGLVLPSGETAGEKEEDAGLFGGFRVDLQFGAAGALVKRYNLARLTPLPSVEKPSFVYLGVLDDGKTALFLNPTEAAVSGDAECLPSPEESQRIQLKAGQTGTLSAPTLNGQAEEYEIAVDGITKVEAATAEEARANIKRESPAGSPRPAPAHHRGRLAGQRSELLGRLGRARAAADAGPLAAPHTLQRLMALRMITAGESHGPGLTTIVEGLPAGLALDREAIDRDMARRQLGHGRGGRMKIEKDAAEVTSGVRHGGRWAGRSPCRSPTATTPTGKSA
jgi:hypothetical protein